MNNGINSVSSNAYLKLDTLDNKKADNINKKDSIQVVEKKATLNLDNKIDFSIKKSGLSDFKPAINFLSNKDTVSAFKESSDTIKNSINLLKLNESVNNKLAEDILKQAIAQ